MQLVHKYERTENNTNIESFCSHQGRALLNRGSAPKTPFDVLLNSSKLFL